jgi:hypothetical protein
MKPVITAAVVALAAASTASAAHQGFSGNILGARDRAVQLEDGAELDRDGVRRRSPSIAPAVALAKAMAGHF